MARQWMRYRDRTTLRRPFSGRDMPLPQHGSANEHRALLENLRATLTKLESVSRPHDDGPAMAELKTNLRLRIATLEIALRRDEGPVAGKE